MFRGSTNWACLVLTPGQLSMNPAVGDGQKDCWSLGLSMNKPASSGSGSRRPCTSAETVLALLFLSHCGLSCCAAEGGWRGRMGGGFGLGRRVRSSVEEY